MILSIELTSGLMHLRMQFIYLYHFRQVVPYQIIGFIRFILHVRIYDHGIFDGDSLNIPIVAFYIKRIRQLQGIGSVGFINRFIVF